MLPNKHSRYDVHRTDNYLRKLEVLRLLVSRWLPSSDKTIKVCALESVIILLIRLCFRRGGRVAEGARLESV